MRAHRTVHLIGGPHCGLKVSVDADASEVRTALVGSAWGIMSETTSRSEAAKHWRVGTYRSRSALDASLGRWTWKEPG